MTVPMHVLANLLGLLLAMSALNLQLGPLYREVAIIAYHFHWSREECMGMSRVERLMWIGEIGNINKEISRAMKPKGRK